MKTTFKNFTLLFIVALLTGAGACKKNSSTVNCKLTKVQTGTDTSLVTYNAEGRVASFGNLLSGIYSFTYGGLTAAASAQYYDTSMHHTCSISLDANGRMVFMSRTMLSSGVTQYYTYSFQYDDAGQVVLCDQSHRIAGLPDITYYRDSLIYAGGNLTDKYTFQKYNAGSYSLLEHMKMEYGTELNKIGGYVYYGYEPPMISTSNRYMAFVHLLGNICKNLPVTTKFYDATETLYIQVAYSFLFDENGYPIEENMIRSVNSVGVTNRKFEYSCE